jgi:Fic family protein
MNDENNYQMEPMLIGETTRRRRELSDLALELATRAAGFQHSMPPGILKPLSHLVRSVNCYYSNLIEGHDTHPIATERALKQDFSTDSHRRDLQLEAKAHIEVQAWIDSNALNGHETTVAGIREIHRHFCARLPASMLQVGDPETNITWTIIPGSLRQKDVRVGQHVAVSPDAVPRFLDRFEKAYGNLGKADLILAAAPAHHRLLWIHPFLDGNGRVARLMSHAMLLRALDTENVWSLSRGLGRRVDEYKGHLSACDQRRRNDLDGRGQLSEEALIDFTRFFLETCLDEVDFMEQLMQPERLRTRILQWAVDEATNTEVAVQSRKILDAVLVRGELPRDDVPILLDTSDDQARRTTAWLQEMEALTSDGTLSPLKLSFPASLATQWMPGLFPER